MPSATNSFVSVKAAGDRSGDFRKSSNPEPSDHAEGKGARGNHRLQFVLDKVSPPVGDELLTPYKKFYLDLEKYNKNNKSILRDKMVGRSQLSTRLMCIEGQGLAHVGNLDEQARSNIENIQGSEINSSILGNQNCTREIHFDRANWKKSREAIESVAISMIELQYHKEIDSPFVGYSEDDLRSIYENRSKTCSESVGLPDESEIIKSDVIANEFLTVPDEKQNQIQNRGYDSITTPDVFLKSNQGGGSYSGVFISLLPLLSAVPLNKDPEVGGENSKPWEKDRQRVTFSNLDDRDHQNDLGNRGWVTKQNTNVAQAADQKLAINGINTSAEKKMTKYHTVRELNIQMSESPDMKIWAAEQLKSQHYKQDNYIVSAPQTKSIFQSEVLKGHIVEPLHTRKILGVHVHRSAEISEIQLLSEESEMTELLARNQNDLKLSLRKIGVENFSLSFSTGQGLADNKSRSSTGEDDNEFIAPEPIDTSRVECSDILVDGLNILV